MFDKPVGRFKNGRYGNNWWFKYSSKVSRNVDFYSDLEYDNWILVEADRAIKTFTEQPHRVQEWLNGEYIDTIFDLWCVPHNEKGYLVEVKYEHELDPSHPQYSERSARQVEKQRKWCEHYGYKYIVSTDKVIRENMLLLNNWKQILPYIDNRIIQVETDKHRILKYIQTQQRSTLRNLDNAHEDISKHRIRSALFNLIYEGAVNANLDKIKICSELEIWSNE